MGCSSSVKATSNPENVNSLKGPNEELNTPSTVGFIENSVLVWLTDQSSRKIEDYVTPLRRVISALKVFDNIDTCYSFLKSIEDEMIFLIVSKEHEGFIEQFSELPQIYKIYIFDPTNHTHENDKHDHSLQSNVFRNINNLCHQLTEDRELVEDDSLFVVTINPATSNGISPKRTGLFLISQHLKFLIVRYKFEASAKTVFADFCRAHYTDDPERLREVNDYDQSYRPKNALKWLVRTCFVSRVLNRMQRVPEIDLMYKLGFMMKHIHNVLVNFHDSMGTLVESTLFTFYRGKTMSEDEFNSFTKDIIGSFLSSAAFLVANTDKNLTIDFLRRIITHRPQRIAVLFEIHIEPTAGTSAPFALLGGDGDRSQSQSDEFCFTMGTIFRVESIEKTNQFSFDIWMVRLVIADESDPPLSRILKQVRNDEAQANATIFFTKLFMDAGYLHRVEKHYFLFLQDKSIQSQPRRLARISSAVANLLTIKNEFDKAVHYYQMALDSCLSVLKPDHPDLISIYNSLGECYSKIKKYSLALENYEKAAEIMRENNFQSIDQETMNSLNTHIAEMRQLLEHNQ